VKRQETEPIEMERLEKKLELAMASGGAAGHSKNENVPERHSLGMRLCLHGAQHELGREAGAIAIDPVPGLAL
jgi:hypothetical protein